MASCATAAGRRMAPSVSAFEEVISASQYNGGALTVSGSNISRRRACCQINEGVFSTRPANPLTALLALKSSREAKGIAAAGDQYGQSENGIACPRCVRARAPAGH